MSQRGFLKQVYFQEYLLMKTDLSRQRDSDVLWPMSDLSDQE